MARAQSHAPLRRPGPPVPGLFPARLLDAPADGSGRAALCPGIQADAGEPRPRRHPLPGRGPPQEAGRHLLAAKCDGRPRRGCRAAGSPDNHRLLPHPVADRRGVRRASDVLGGAGIPGPSGSLPVGGPHGHLDHPHGRGPPGQDRCGAPGLLRRRHGRIGAGLSESRRRRASLSMPRGFLARIVGRDPHQRPDGGDVHRPRRPGSVHPRAVARVAFSLEALARAGVEPHRGAAVVRRHCPQEPRRVLRRIRRTGHAGEGRRGPAGALGPSGLLPRRLLRHLLARRRSGGHCRAVRLGELVGTMRSRSCSPGSCHPGSCSRSCRRSCLTT